MGGFDFCLASVQQFRAYDFNTFRLSKGTLIWAFLFFSFFFTGMGFFLSFVSVDLGCKRNTALHRQKQTYYYLFIYGMDRGIWVIHTYIHTYIHTRQLVV